MVSKMKDIDIHADDYALTPGASQDILECIRKGKLDSVSVLTNMSCYDADAAKYLAECEKWEKQPLLSVHLNFMEGSCQARPEQVPHLVNEKGYFKIGWKDLLLWSYHPILYGKIKQELKAEIEAQTKRFIQYFGDEKPLRFDGHQHTQMIPIVYHALVEVIKDKGYQTSYIRVTKEPILPFLQERTLWKTYRPVNWIKNLLLNFYAPFMEKKVIREASGQDKMFIWGVLFSGHMDEKRVGKLLEVMKRRAEKKGRVLEILFHPGFSDRQEMGEEFVSEDANAFYNSEGRREEYHTLMNLQSCKSGSICDKI